MSTHKVRNGDFSIKWFKGGVRVRCERCHLISAGGGRIHRPGAIRPDTVAAAVWIDEHEHTNWLTLEHAETEARARAGRRRKLRDAGLRFGVLRQEE